jgi:benzoyl-CoA reductase subunit A
MSVYLGIDLGSTTTKAVILDENENILGRGITNTRSDYHVATSVAESEARISARFTILRRLGEQRDVPAELLLTLEDEFSLAAFRFRLQRLRKLAREQAGAKGGAFSERLCEALEEIFDQIDDELTGDAEASLRRRSSFFRDLVGARFMNLSESEAGKFGLDFEDLMGVFDVVILKEENSVLDIDFQGNIQACPAYAGVAEDRAEALRDAVEGAAAATLDVLNMVGTGYGRQRLPFRKDQIRSEILCHGLGAHYFFPETRTVLDIGGQDTKAIQLDQSGIATNFQMNDRCAAGCGRYLGYIADELNLSLDELGPLALQSTRPVQVSSTCTVFAGAELRERLELGERREDILAGLHRAIILRAMSLLARSGGIKEQFTFTGGVARNPAVVKALEDLMKDNYGDVTLNNHPDSIYMGAVGAALYARRDLPSEGLAMEDEA